VRPSALRAALEVRRTLTALARYVQMYPSQSLEILAAIMSQSSKRRFDPDRRSRIIDATLDIIAEWGVAGTTHRRVAEAADVPLGSMTYHFDSLEQLLTEAFMRLSETVSDQFVALLSAAETPEQARDAVVEIVLGTHWATPRNLLLSYELYAYAGRNPALQSVMRSWMAQSRQALERHFDPLTSRALDALIEGMTIHNSVDPLPGGREHIAEIIDRLTLAPRSSAGRASPEAKAAP
jgi:TetR/AcrR family transcriptional regulator, regulator of biofilm formation and stress response